VNGRAFVVVVGRARLFARDGRRSATRCACLVGGFLSAPRPASGVGRWSWVPPGEILVLFARSVSRTTRRLWRAGGPPRAAGMRPVSAEDNSEGSGPAGDWMELPAPAAAWRPPRRPWPARPERA
jgi:hypothetical protein